MRSKISFLGLAVIVLFFCVFYGIVNNTSYAQDLIVKGDYHTADRNQDYKIDLSELLRIIQFFNARAYHCDPEGEDGYAPGTGDQSCEPHDSDYEPNTPWRISLNELLRLVQFYNVCGYEVDPSKEDGFRPVLCPVIIEGEPEGTPEGLEGEGFSEGVLEGEGETYNYARIIVDRRDSVPNTEINIPLTLETKNVALGYVQFDLIFNSNRIQYLDYMIGPAIQTTGRNLSVGQIIPGKIRLTTTGTSTSGMTSGIYAILRFKVSDNVEFNDVYSIYAESIMATSYPDGLIYPLSVLAGYIRIYSSFPYPPTAEFSATPVKNIINSEIEFRDESKMGNGTEPTWQWNFGDGSFSFLRNPTHIYQSPGVYTVTLTVTTSAGQSIKQKTGYIEIIHGSRIYVKKPQTKNPKEEIEPDGLSWATAFPTLQEGIDKAFELGGGEVWVAAGDYNEVRSNPYGALILRELVNVYGGFQGTETELNQRNYQTNITIINGSVARNGQPAWHVVRGENYSELNGFIIKGGDSRYDTVYSDAQDGGGLYIPAKKMVVKNCSFFQNKAVGVGAGVCCISGKLSIYNCNFIENMIENISSASSYNYGSAIYVSDSVVNIQNSRFESNRISSQGIWQTSTQNITAVSAGGGIFAYNSSLSIDNCLFYSNTCSAEGIGHGTVGGGVYGAFAKALGGAIYLWYSDINLRNSDFRNNSVSTNDHNGFSRASAGMIYLTRSSAKIVNVIGFRNKAYDFSSSIERTGGVHIDLCENVVFSNCTLYDNQADLTTTSHGGAVFNYYSNVAFANTIVWQNSGQGTYSLGNDAIFMYCNTQQVKNGTGNISSDPLFIFPSAGNFRLNNGSPCIDRGMDTSSNEWGNVLTDIEGNLRGRDAIPGVTGDGSDYDMGAYEY